MESPWKRADKARKAQQSEKKLTELPDSQLQPNSGRGRFRKRDGRVFGDMLIENRFTEAGSYTISKQELTDLTKQAIRQPPGCRPGMAIDFNGERWLLVRERDFENLYERLELLEST